MSNDKNMRTYEVKYRTFNGEQTSIRINAMSRSEAKRVVEDAPAVQCVIGTPSVVK